MDDSGPIRAAIGVDFNAPRTFYVLRSMQMKNYPGVWSLPSIQYAPHELLDPLDLEAAAKIFDRMSRERFANTPIKVLQYLVAGRSEHNPMQRMVELVLYRISFTEEPYLNRSFYTESASLAQYEFDLRTTLSALPCGLCVKLWRQYQQENVSPRALA